MIRSYLLPPVTKSIDKVKGVWYPENAREKYEAETSYNCHYALLFE